MTRQSNVSNSRTEGLKDFPNVAPPSDNYQHNIGTFYYRLSELMFGNLLASYILGFIAFASIDLPPPGSGIPNFIARSVWEALNLHSLGFWSFLQSVLTSVLYSSLTALLYVNFHQSVVYMAIDQRKASYDFFIAIFIGITFGISLVFSLSVIFWLGILTLIAFLRKDALLKEYGRHVCLEVARAADWTVPPGTSPYDAKIRQEIVAVVMPQLQAGLLKSNSRVAKSWGHVGGLKIWLAILVMIAAPAAVFVLGFWGVGLGGLDRKFPDGVAWLVLCNLGSSILTLAVLVALLIQAGRIMPSKEEMDAKVLDHELIDVLVSVREVLKATGGRWRALQVQATDEPTVSNEVAPSDSR